MNDASLPFITLLLSWPSPQNPAAALTKAAQCGAKTGVSHHSGGHFLRIAAVNVACWFVSTWRLEVDPCANLHEPTHSLIRNHQRVQKHSGKVCRGKN